MKIILGKAFETVSYLLAIYVLAGEWHWALNTGWPILATYLGR